jgi:hypothetical protein
MSSHAKGPELSLEEMIEALGRGETFEDFARSRQEVNWERAKLYGRAEGYTNGINRAIEEVEQMLQNDLPFESEEFAKGWRAGLQDLLRNLRATATKV